MGVNPARVLFGGLLVLAASSAWSDDECLTWTEANARAETLRDQGDDPTVESHPCPHTFHVVRVDLDDSQGRAEAIARLQEFDIETEPVGTRGLWVGAFDTADDAEARLLEMFELGYRNVVINETQTDVVRYRVLVAEPETDDDADTFVFGEDDETGEADDGEDDPLRWVTWRLDDLRLTSGYLPRSRQPVETYHDGTVSASVRWQPPGPWEFRAGARLDGQAQTPRRSAEDVGTAWATPDYTENWVRYRAPWGRVTAGTQVVPWGTMDLQPPGDRLSVQDLTRGPLNPVDDARRASPSLRLERYGEVDVDVVFTPMFRPAELPRADTLWHPVDQRRGRLLGVPDDAAVRALVREGSFDHEPRGRDRDPVGGVRLSRSGRALDWGLTLQSTRSSAPYYALTNNARDALQAELSDDEEAAIAAAAAAEGDTFEARHPRTVVAGGDVALDAGGVTWRLEGVWSSAEPATREDDFSYVTRRGVEWAAGAEFFPGDRDLRVSLQLTGEHLLNAGNVIDPTRTYQLGGEVEQPWDRERWHTRLRFNLGLDRSDVYINPEVAWSAQDQSEVVLGAHYFRGDDDTLGGYFEDHYIVTIGWRLTL